MHVYSEIIPTECNGAYSQESVLSIAVLNDMQNIFFVCSSLVSGYKVVDNIPSFR